MKKLLSILVITSFLMSCNSPKNQDNIESAPVDTLNVAAKNNLGTVAVYEGILPCADCSGIETTLKIYAGDGTMETHKFELISVYKGKDPETTFTEQGTYNYEKGIGKDPNGGTVYVLNWDKPEAERIYYGITSTDPNKIFLLDNKRELIKSELNYSLTLKK